MSNAAPNASPLSDTEAELPEVAAPRVDIAAHRAFAAAYPRTKERDNSEKYGSLYIIGFADWHGKTLPAVVNTETGLTSKPMSRTLAQRWCCGLNYQEFRCDEGSSIYLTCDTAKMLRRLHGLAEEY